MKHIITILAAMAFFCAGALAQNYQEVVYLKNGSIIKGTVIEQEIGGNIKIKTADGSLFVYKMDEVQKITKEEIKGQGAARRQPETGAARQQSDLGSFRGPRFSATAGIMATLGDYSFASGVISLGYGKDVSDQIYFGGGLQLGIPFNDSFPVTPSLFAENRIYFPSSSNVSFLLRDRLSFSTDIEFESAGLGIALLPSVMLPLNPTTDLLLSAGYQLGLSLDGGGAGHNLGFMATFDFHRAYGTAARTKPYRRRGVEVGGYFMMFPDVYEDHGETAIEPEIHMGLSIGYRFSPHLSIGMELSMNDTNFVIMEDGREVSSTYTNGPSLGLNGRYRLLDKTWSPVASVSVGIGTANEAGEKAFEDHNVPAFYFFPRIGASLRPGAGNGHLEFYVGPSMGFTNVKRWNQDKRSLHSFAQVEFGLSYYHTLKLGSGIFNDVQLPGFMN